jgi:hypothetical protein
MDQLPAYEPNPNMLHYTTRLIDGLKPTVHMIVVVQRPLDLDTLYVIFFVQKDVGDEYLDLESPHHRHPNHLIPPNK